MLYNPLDLNESENSPLYEVDPDLQVLNEMYNSNNLLKSDYHISNTFKSQLQRMKVTREACSFFHLNMQNATSNSMTKERQLYAYLKLLDHEFTAVGLSETWFTKENCKLFQVMGYQDEHTVRSNRAGGGVSIYIKPGISYKIRKDLIFLEDSIETIFVEIDSSCLNIEKNLVVGVVYRPPNTVTADFLEKMSTILRRIGPSTKQCRIMGDFNLNLLDTDNFRPTTDFVDLMFSFSMFPLINKPTRSTSDTATCIDNIFSNHVTPTSKSIQGILYTDISDHFPIFFIDINTKGKIEKKTLFRRAFTPEAKSSFTAEIESTDWLDIIDTSVAQNAMTKFHSRFKNIFDKHFPTKQINVGYKNRKEWLPSPNFFYIFEKILPPKAMKNINLIETS